MASNSNSLSLDGPYPTVIAPKLQLVQAQDALGEAGVKIEDGALTIEHEDGTVTIDFDPSGRTSLNADLETGHNENLALSMGEDDLADISSLLLDAIDQDDHSRRDWLDTRAQGIDLLGLKIERQRSTGASDSAPVEGMATVRHPLLLNATISFQATARGELLPASGPVKVRNDTPSPPRDANIQKTNALNDLEQSLQGKDELAQALETDMNHWLTAVATEYVPDTDRMLFYVGFGGDGFKKVYHCPLRNRPVSESVDAKDLIVSNTAVDLQSCGRVTHRIMMRKSILKRMQIMGTYRDCDLSDPAIPNTNPVDKKVEEINGIKDAVRRPEDRDYEVYETYCELDLDQYAPKQFKGKGLPLPYRVTVEKGSRQILDIRRNWKEDDEQCLPKQFFVQFPFVRGLGFYGLGYIHILGNTANTLTAAWRLILDNGMFANFPGFLYAKSAGRQNSNQFRVAPGQGVGLDVSAQQSIKDSVMPLPYKEAGAAFTSFITHVEEVGNKLASAGDINVGEGKQDAPVGTTLALIEQATKVLDSAHKRLHAAQAEEFKLLKERFKEDPEAFWRHNPNASIDWRKEQLMQALNDFDLVPVADPNNPTSLHRIAKGMAIKELQKANPNLYDAVAVDMRIMRIVGIDPQGLFNATPTPAPPDPRMEAIKAKAQQAENAQNIAQLQAQIKAATAYAQMEDKERDRQSRERIAEMEKQLEQMKIEQASIIHANDIQHDQTLLEIEKSKAADERLQTLQRGFAEDQIRRVEAAREDGIRRLEAARDHSIAQHQHLSEAARAHQEHMQKLEHANQLHQTKLDHAKELGQAKVEVAKKMSAAKPKPSKEKK